MYAIILVTALQCYFDTESTDNEVEVFCTMVRNKCT